jgi:hypothetical protein
METNNKESTLSEKYVYYRTIPVLKDWMTLKYIPETYRNFFEEDGRHYDYDKFVSKYNEDKSFKEFIDEQHFRKLIEDYFVRNANICCFPRFPYRYGSGRYSVEIRWKDTYSCFYYNSNYISVD